MILHRCDFIHCCLYEAKVKVRIDIRTFEVPGIMRNERGWCKGVALGVIGSVAGKPDDIARVTECDDLSAAILKDFA